MGKIHESITPKLQEWIANQKVFFVSTAPLSGDGLVNCSPKGLDSFRVLGEQTAAYLDLTGSGVETIAHLKENGRITIMFVAFEGAPKILRLYGQGEVYEKDSADFERLKHHFPEHMGARSIVLVRCQRIQDSCGYSIPVMKFEKDRDVLDKWCEKKGADGIVAYQKARNARSLDGLKGFGD